MRALSAAIPFRLGSITSQIHGILRIHSLEDIGTIFPASEGHHPIEVHVAAYVGRFACCVDDGINFSNVTRLMIGQLLSSNNLPFSPRRRRISLAIPERTPPPVALERS